MFVVYAPVMYWFVSSDTDAVMLMQFYSEKSLWDLAIEQANAAEGTVTVSTPKALLKTSLVK